MTVRPRRLVLVTGTTTGVGKTWMAAAALRRLAMDGVAVAARKPVQSFTAGESPTDAEVLADATGAPPTRVCPRHRWYELPLAPPMAAAELDRPVFAVADLVEELAWEADTHVGVVEGVGGPRSPLASDGDTVDLAAALGPDLVVVVAEAELGSINAVRLCADALEAWPVLVALNRFDADNSLHCANRSWLIERAELDVVTGAEELARRLPGR